MYLEIEAKLYDEYKQLRRQGLKVKGYWFKIRGKQLLTQMNLDSEVHSFQFCDGWFDAFKQRHKISFRRSTNMSQKPPDHKRGAIQTFHRHIRQVVGQGKQVGPLEQFQLHQIANVDQTPLLFCFADGETCRHWGQDSLGLRRCIKL